MAQGGSQDATKMGEASGETFVEACRAFIRQKPHLASSYHDDTIHGPTIWGCRLFDNEADARRSFG